MFIDTGYVKKGIRAEHIRNGKVKDLCVPIVCGVGFLGDGKYTPRHSIAYKKWKAMIERCYSDSYQQTHPTYVGCTAADVWHNFQNFAEWFYTQDYKKGYELDKDIKVSGNKEYSPEKCLLVSKADNAAEMNRRTKK